jgi:mRNA interferase MazF
LNIGFEENGKDDFKRPVLVICRIGVLFFIVPLSTQDKGNKFYYTLKSVSFNKPSLAILSQVRMIDKKRFVHRIGQVSEEEMINIEKLLKDLYLSRA